MNRRERDQLFEDAQQAIGAAHDDVERAVAALKALLEAGDSVDLNTACPVCSGILAELKEAAPGVEVTPTKPEPAMPSLPKEKTWGVRKGDARWN